MFQFQTKIIKKHRFRQNHTAGEGDLLARGPEIEGIEAFEELTEELLEKEGGVGAANRNPRSSSSSSSSAAVCEAIT